MDSWTNDRAIFMHFDPTGKTLDYDEFLTVYGVEHQHSDKQPMLFEAPRFHLGGWISLIRYHIKSTSDAAARGKQDTSSKLHQTCFSTRAISSKDAADPSRSNNFSTDRSEVRNSIPFQCWRSQIRESASAWDDLPSKSPSGTSSKSSYGPSPRLCGLCTSTHQPPCGCTSDDQW